MFACKNCQCSSSLESIELPPHSAEPRYEPATRRTKKSTAPEPQAYRKLRISSFLTDPPNPPPLPAPNPLGTLIPVHREPITTLNTSYSSSPSVPIAKVASSLATSSAVANNINHTMTPAQPSISRIDENRGMTSSPSLNTANQFDSRTKVMFDARELNQMDLNRWKIARQLEQESLLPRTMDGHVRTGRSPAIGSNRALNRTVRQTTTEPKANPNPEYNFDYNLYSIKKNIGQGLIDIALLAANSNQLKNIISSGVPPLRKSMSYDGRESVNHWPVYVYWINLVLVALSIGLQVMVGILLLFNSKSSTKRASRPKRNAECYNNMILIFVLFITVINVFLVIFVDELDLQQNSNSPSSSSSSPYSFASRFDSNDFKHTNSNLFDSPESRKWQTVESQSPIQKPTPIGTNQNGHAQTIVPSTGRPLTVAETISTEKSNEMDIFISKNPTISKTTQSIEEAEEEATSVRPIEIHLNETIPIISDPVTTSRIDLVAEVTTSSPSSLSVQEQPSLVTDNLIDDSKVKQEIKEPIKSNLNTLNENLVNEINLHETAQSQSVDTMIPSTMNPFPVQPVYRTPIESLLISDSLGGKSKQDKPNYELNKLQSRSANSKPLENAKSINSIDSMKSIEPHKSFEYTPQFWPPPSSHQSVSGQTIRPLLSNYWTTFNTNS